MRPFLLLVPIGLLMCGLGWPLFRGKVKQNFWYGVRLPLTLENERAWYDLNRRGGKGLVIVGSCVLFVTTLLFVLKWNEAHAVLVDLGILLVGTIALAIDLFRAARRWPN